MGSIVTLDGGVKQSSSLRNKTKKQQITIQFILDNSRTKGAPFLTLFTEKDGSPKAVSLKPDPYKLFHYHHLLEGLSGP